MSKHGALIWIEKSDELARKMSNLKVSYDEKCREYSDLMQKHTEMKGKFEQAQENASEPNNQEDLIRELNEKISKLEKQNSELQEKMKKELESAQEKIKQLNEENIELRKRFEGMEILDFPVELMDVETNDEIVVVGDTAVEQSAAAVEQSVAADQLTAKNQPGASNEQICDKCQSTIKGSLSQLRAHQRDHCQSKPSSNMACPVCRSKYNYNGLRYHLKYYTKEEKISKATSKFFNHRYYTAEQHVKMRDTLVKTAEKFRVDGRSTEQYAEELSKILLHFVKELPKRPVEQADYNDPQNSEEENKENETN